MFRKLSSAFIVLAIAAAAIAPASAGPGKDTSSMRVSYADLDLSRIEGIHTLIARIERALNQTCGRAEVSASLSVRRSIWACQKQGMDAAVASIDAPLLTAVYTDSDGTQMAGF